VKSKKTDSIYHILSYRTDSVKPEKASSPFGASADLSFTIFGLHRLLCPSWLHLYAVLRNACVIGSLNLDLSIGLSVGP